MSYKTDKLVQLFPDAYAATEKESLLYKLLDAIGAEFMTADESVKQLLKSHWVNYATGKALDGLGSIYGVTRRRLRDATMETDDAFRRRLKSVVPMFTGGGTVRAVLGAVRSALGLPFDLDQLNLPTEFAALRRDIENLVRIEEFSPKGERIVGRNVQEVNNASEVRLVIDIPTVREDRPTIQWTFLSGGGRDLSLELLPTEAGGVTQGIKSKKNLVIPEGSTLTLSSDPDGNLIALIGLQELHHMFTDLDGTGKPVLPDIPLGSSEWRFRAQSGLFDRAVFDRHDTFDLPLFEVEVSWIRYEPLTFDVHVPYFLQDAVAELKRLHHYTGKLFVYEGLPLQAIAEVVDLTRAAGVEGSLQFSLNFFERHNPKEIFIMEGEHAALENESMRESLLVSSVNELDEHHLARDRFVIGGVYDISTFDTEHGFAE
ncbi:hypothetical protein EH223_19280 [candidate division KSB1 bacterium]|nr:hypothetical protein [candidate division KSB1 bacterium]RQW00093.1 MAG: hypothetical protein EH223_19280 [candidate division KSB1 bacterium]